MLRIRNFSQRVEEGEGIIDKIPKKGIRVESDNWKGNSGEAASPLLRR